MLGQLRVADQPLGVTAADPAAVFVVKSLLSPVISVLTLVVSLLCWRESVGGPYILVGVLAFIGTADFFDAAEAGVRHSPLSSIRLLLDIALRWALIFGFIWVLAYLSGLTDRFNNDVIVSWSLATPVALWICQLAAQPALLNFSLRHTPPKKAVVVGLTEIGTRLEDKLRADPLLHTEVLGFFEDRNPSRLPPDRVHRILGTPAELPAYVLRHGVHIVYITLPMSRDRRVLTLLDSLRDSTVSIYFVPDLFIFNLIQARLDHLSGIPVVAVRESPFYGVRGFAKRLSDVAIAGAVTVMISPILLAIAVGIRVSSPGPILFKQRRYGLDGKQIIVYKFRSMTVTEDGESTYTQVTRGDRRVTPFGAFLRRTSLDELPQLFNVLEGSMSIVGPRPHAVMVNEQYRRLIPSYMVRHKVKPGITGWAQVNGYRGGDDLASMEKRIEFDLQYLRHWSLRLDFMILAKTATLVLTDRSAY
jgi:putative colanic acid biosynthesis UDP-glucose lipid carrier transferase